MLHDTSWCIRFADEEPPNNNDRKSGAIIKENESLDEDSQDKYPDTGQHDQEEQKIDESPDNKYTNAMQYVDQEDEPMLNKFEDKAH